MRDRTLVLIAYRHGLRVGELVALRWDQVDLKWMTATPSDGYREPPLTSICAVKSAASKPEIDAMMPVKLDGDVTEKFSSSTL